MTDNDDLVPFVSYLESLAEDRAALAALRRGLGQTPGVAPEMYRYVVPRLPPGLPRWREDHHYLVAALFGLHPLASGGGNMGHHFAQTVSGAGEEDSGAVERRFTILLNAHADDLPFLLRQAVSYLRSREVPVNYHRLLRDLQWWNSEHRTVQRSWANAFWGRGRAAEEPS
jgi:CRISPR system Cascade subunit CasB